VLRLAKRSGINGLLLEWEDTFLGKVTSQIYPYREEAEEIVAYAERTLGLEVIPLVQTFGHVEFVLKMEQFRHLENWKEIPKHFVLQKVERLFWICHKNSKLIHIGCDEVYTCASDYRDELFLKHVIDVASYVRSKARIPIIWDDMLRSIPIRKLNDSGIGQLVEPMVWVYAEDVDRFVGWESWEKYAEVFPTIWAAAAFKGAFGETLSIPPAMLIMFKGGLMYSHGNHPSGLMVLTGWMRYDHFSVLCELLPGAVPSLVYTSLTLSTHRARSLEATTISPSSSSSSIAPIPSGSNNNEILSSSSVTSSSLSSSSNNGLDPISITTDDPLSQPSPRIFRRSARNFRSIPHPRILMANRDGFSNQRLHAREIVTQPVIFDKGEIVSRLFEEILVCPNHPQQIFRVRSLLDDIWELEAKISRKRGWVTPYNIRHNYSLPLRVDEVVFSQVPRLQRHLVILANSVVNSLKPIFPTETILEWIEQNMWEAWKALDKLEKAGDTLRNIQVWPRRPVPSPQKMVDDLRLTALDDSENTVDTELKK
ncbi:Hexosaminidase D, partial [Orchesella cincta]